MSDSTGVQFLRGVIGFLTLGLTTPTLFLLLTMRPVVGSPVEELGMILFSVPAALVGIVTYPSWLLVVLAGAVALATSVPDAAIRRWAFVCVFTGASTIWSLLEPDFPRQQTVELAVSAAFAALLTLYFCRPLYRSSAA
jgi:hypothetical protein